MIKFENVEVMNFEGALRGMRNPLNSWDQGDSRMCPKDPFFNDCLSISSEDRPCPRTSFDYDCFCMGPNDLNLAQRLIKAGPDHRKFLRQIFVSVDITAPLYWWKEFDTYKVSTVANSCSTMHTIHAKEIELSDFSFENIYIEKGWVLGDYFQYVVEKCEKLRTLYLDTKNKKYWRALIQLLPESYNQRRTVTLNYETLRNIYGSRRNHKLDEWSIGFMEWIDSLPYSEELIKYDR